MTLLIGPKCPKRQTCLCLYLPVFPIVWHIWCMRRMNYKNRVSCLHVKCQSMTEVLYSPVLWGLSCIYLGELIGYFWGEWVLGGLLLQWNHHKVLKKLPLLPLDELQLQSAVARCPAKDGLQFQQSLGVGWRNKGYNGKARMAHVKTTGRSSLYSMESKLWICIGWLPDK